MSNATSPHSPTPDPIVRICWEGITGFKFTEPWMPQRAAEAWLPYLQSQSPKVKYWIEGLP